ncbi:hypothetical protein [Pseudooceanicola algae]|uniref:Uncharacterized protein n=1 Tax=Pseudooceanicola algae TaxID=1537215 RepID=A0A418SF58_9RHOB|nr:hypothetical protein [Pseudooceanicola algae]QPM89274.1 hypothetical protein PSAL_004890 [Pseudooceanicola algae]
MTGTTDICRTTCLGLGLVMALAITIGLSGGMPVLLALVLGLLIAGAATSLLLRMVCGSAAAGEGPVATLRSQVAEAMHTPVGEPAPGQTRSKAAKASAAAELPEKVTARDTKKAPKPAAKKGAAKAASKAGKKAVAGKDGAKKKKTPAKGDDLKRIKGLGPRFEKALHEAGITGFAQLAAMSPADFEALEAVRPGLAARAEGGDWTGQAKVLAVETAGSGGAKPASGKSVSRKAAAGKAGAGE